MPILVLADFNNEQLINKAYASGATDLLPKPVNPLLLGYRACHIFREHQAVDHLHRSRVQQLAVFEGIPDPLLIFDNELRVAWANPAAADCFGAGRDQLVGRAPFELWADADETGKGCLTRRCLTTGTTVSGKRRTGDGRLWGVRIFPIRGLSGDVERAVLLAHDITDKIRVQEDTLRNSQLASLGELAAGVAHEINNPISGVINYAQIMINRSTLNEGDLDLVKRIQNEGTRISTIVSSLLNMARTGSDSKTLGDIRPVIEDALNLFATRFHRDGILLHIDLGDDLPPVHIQRQQIQQVIINLISNAIYALNDKEFGPEQRKLLEISVEKRIFNGQPMLATTVFDRGRGVPEEILDKIMHPFFTTKPTGQGTGLGLSISHKIVRDHGGLLTVDSDVGEFTRVTILLPLENKN